MTKSDFIKKKKLYKDFSKSILKIENIEETFKNIETNILSKFVINEENNVTENSKFLDINLKFLLTTTKYPHINELKKAVLSCINKSFCQF